MDSKSISRVILSYAENFEGEHRNHLEASVAVIDSMNEREAFSFPFMKSKEDPLKGVGSIPKGPASKGPKDPTTPGGMRQKSLSMAKGNPYDTIVTTILSKPGVDKLYEALKNVAPKAYQLIDKYVTRWNAMGDKLRPSGGLTSKAAEEELEAASKEQDIQKVNEALVNMIEDFEKTYDNSWIRKELKASYYDLLKKARDTRNAPIEDPNEINQDQEGVKPGEEGKLQDQQQEKQRSPEEQQKDDAIKAFTNAFNKAYPINVRKDLPGQLSKELNNMLSSLNKMVRGDVDFLQRKKQKAPLKAPEKTVPQSAKGKLTTIPTSVKQKASPAQSVKVAGDLNTGLKAYTAEIVKLSNLWNI